MRDNQYDDTEWTAFSEWFAKQWSYAFNVVRKKAPYLKDHEIHDIILDLFGRLQREGHQTMGPPCRRNLCCHLRRERNRYLRHKLSDRRGGMLEHLCADGLDEWLLWDKRSRHIERWIARNELATLLVRVKTNATERQLAIIRIVEAEGTFQGREILRKLTDQERRLFLPKDFEGQIDGLAAHSLISKAVNRNLYELRARFKGIRDQN